MSAPAIAKTVIATQRSQPSISPEGNMSCGKAKRIAEPNAEARKATNMPSHTI
jgi:hypothetical protein